MSLWNNGGAVNAPDVFADHMRDAVLRIEFVLQDEDVAA